jgi:TP901 family phage tail tape measure protein
VAIAAKRNAKVEITASTSKFDSGLRDARKKLKSFGTHVKGNLKGAGSLIGKIGSGMSMGLGMGAVNGVTGAASDMIEAEKAMTRFEIATKMTAGQMGAFRAELLRVSSAQGVSRDALLNGASLYYDLASDAAGASENVELFAKASLASGASVEDLARTAAALKNSLNIDSTQMQKAFDVLITQGDLGSISLKNLGEEFAAVAPAFAQFDGAQTADGVAQIVAAFQVAGKSFNGAAETATGLKNLFTTLDRKAARLSKAGVQVFDKNGNRRSFEAIRQDLRKLPDKDLISILGDSQSATVVRAMNTHGAMFDDLLAKSRDSNAVEVNAAKFRESSAGKLGVLMETLKNKIAAAFTPERIEYFINAVTKLGEGIGSLIDKLHAAATAIGEGVGALGEDNSGDGIGGFIGGSTGINLGAAGTSLGFGGKTVDGKTADQARAYADKVGREGDDAAARLHARLMKEKETKTGAFAPKPGAAPPVNVTVAVDGNAIATATANASDARRRPGG